ncbi:hypothetical protein GOP47_0024057 [Adiantum capillus-veneris]|uniref:Uncharacterized protein n=1 Tax=Adiantum capillus-veneris TaxID=13818 RepID=A0A9D4Z5S2_ADICA|nr:hypothetical protein GOP47_0024057 [Adiantum capillus-veneris]
MPAWFAHAPKPEGASTHVVPSIIPAPKLFDAPINVVSIDAFLFLSPINPLPKGAGTNVDPMLEVASFDAGAM